VAARSRPTGLATLPLVAGLVLALGTVAAGAVDNRAQPSPPSATLPLRGASHGEAGIAAAAVGTDPAGGTRAATRARAATRSLGATRTGRASGAPWGNFDAPGRPPRAAGFEVGDLPGRVSAAGGGSPPVGLVIPSIGVATPLVRLGLDPDGGMQVPEDFGRAGWFAGGPQPGQLGPAVIAGHVDSRTGPAVFYRLRELRAGDVVLVERADGTRLRFLVEGARSFPKARFPTAAVFGPVPSAALRLVTCTGDFDRAKGSYRDNLVVFAHLAGGTG
jgi:hypothetical protein